MQLHFQILVANVCVQPNLQVVIPQSAPRTLTRARPFYKLEIVHFQCLAIHLSVLVLFRML